MRRNRVSSHSALRLVAAFGLLVPVGLAACAVGTEPNSLGDQTLGSAEIPRDRLGLGLSDADRAKALENRWQRRLAARPQEAVTGNVRDIHGAPVQGVIVTAGSARAKTDANGEYTLPNTEIGGHVITFRHPDYVVHQDRVLVYPYQPPYVSAVLLPREAPVVVDSHQAFTVHDDHVTVAFPADALVFKDDGSPVQGDVSIQLTAIDPIDDEVLMAAPAPLEGHLANGSMTSLRSYHMFDLEMKQGTRDLQLRPGALAEMKVDLPAAAEIPSDNRIPMWYHDEVKGAWVQERGVDATIEAQGDHLVATASLPHFTSWNIDSAKDTVVSVFDYVASDAEALEFIAVVEAAVWQNNAWVPSSTGWAMKSTPTVASSEQKRFMMNLPQCGSGYKFKYKLRAKYTGDANYYDLMINPPSATTNPTCNFASTTTAMLEFTSDDVCNFINCLGANKNGAGQAVAPEDGALFGLNNVTTIGGMGANSTDPKQINNTQGITNFSNGQDNRGVQVNGAPRTFQQYRMPFDYTVEPLGHPGSTFPVNDPGYTYYKTTSKTPAGTYYYDIDKDGVKDLVDNCVNHPNNTQADVDGNGVGDVCETWCFISPTDPDRDLYDFDLDTVDDFCDNKPAAKNPSQAP